MKFIVGALGLTVILAGCANLREEGARMAIEERSKVSSGYIGCPPGDITISDQTSTTWTATCRGHVFYCTVSPSASCKASL